LYVQYVLLYLLALVGLHLFSFCLFFTRCQSSVNLWGSLMDPELSRLASSLLFCCSGAKAVSTTERYSRAFEKVRVCAAS